MRRLSGSGLRLAEACPASVHQPPIWQESSDAAAAGTGRHAYLESLQTMSREEALKLVPADAPWRNTAEGIDVEQIPRGRAEVGVAWNVLTGEARWLAGGRASGYPDDIDETWVVGTVDLIAAGHVIDWKGVELVDHPRHNVQLGFYALAVARLEGLDEIRASACHVHPSGRLTWSSADLGPWDLLAIERRLSDLWAAARAASRVEGPYLRGVHCQRCPGLPSCPAALDLVRGLIASPPTVDSLAGVSLEHLAEVWETAAVAQSALALAQRAIEDRVYQLRELPLPGGGQLRVVERTSRRVELAVALPVLQAQCDPEQLDAAIDRSIAVSAVSKLARAGAPKGKGAAVERALWADLTAAGAVTVSQGTGISLIRARVPRGQPQEPFAEPNE